MSAPPQRGLKCCTHVWGRHGVREAHLTGREPLLKSQCFQFPFANRLCGTENGPGWEAGDRGHRSHRERGDGVGQRWLASHFLVTGCVTSARLGPLWASSPSSVGEPTRQLRVQRQPLGKRLPGPLQPPCRSLLPTCFLPSLPGSRKLTTLALLSFPRKKFFQALIICVVFFSSISVCVCLL